MVCRNIYVWIGGIFVVFGREVVVDSMLLGVVGFGNFEMIEDCNLILVDKLGLLENCVLDGWEEFFIRFFKVGLVCVIFGVVVEKLGLGGCCIIDVF